MQYMMLIYSGEAPEGLSPERAEQVKAAHWRLIDEATRKGVLIGVGPLAPTSSATTVRMQNGKALVTDGPFAETKEHLAGYYIIECDNLDEAIEWAAKIPASCRGADGCVEIRPMPGLPARVESAELAGHAV
jgi:hypothetical protein